MAPVHLYLATWVLGGVLLGAEMLLDARGRGASAQVNAAGGLEGGAPGAVADASLPDATRSRDRSPAVLLRLLRVMPLGLIGFGLSGLVAKGLELELWPGTFLVALCIGLGLIALGYRLSGGRSTSASERS